MILTLLLAPAASLAMDNDGDGLQDEWELSYFASLNEQDAAGDPDEDGLTNGEEQDLGTDPTREDTDGDELTDKEELDSEYELDPTNMDTDGDFLGDGQEIDLGTDPTNHDTDIDGLTDYIEVQKNYDPLKPDTDMGGIWDGEEVLVDKTDPLEPSDDLLDSDNDGVTNWYENQLGTSPFAADSDGDWLSDGEEDANHNGAWEPDLGETDPLNMDTDGDGLDDGWETMVYNTDPFEPDSDGDGLTDGEEHLLRLTEPGFDCIDPNSKDSDRDGLTDGEEAGGGNVTSNPCDHDTDDDGLYDVSEYKVDGTNPDDDSDFALDTDGDGLSDEYENTIPGTGQWDDADTDGDGLTDSEEHLSLMDGNLTDPLDADTDDDGILDGTETKDVLGPDFNNPLAGGYPTAFDTDGDGLSDGLEQGLTTPEISAKDPDATDLAVYVPDTDPTTTTDAKDSDSDNDGLSDGDEDADADGFVDLDETDPNLFDTDGDGMDDYWETKYSAAGVCGNALLGPLDPLDVTDKNLDNDGDGLTNFFEYQLTWWEDGEEVKNQTDPCDKDSDDDGLNDKKEVDSKYDIGNFLTPGTDPNDADTDGDGIGDGVEDVNKDGKWNPLLETNPTQKDTDGDNLNDGFENDTVGTSPMDPDSDDDGINDGKEYNIYGTDPLKPDTDEDGLGDGLETGAPQFDECPDSKSNPHKKDTDGDSISDGLEDADMNGCWDLEDGETDPLDSDSDGDKLPDGLEIGLGADIEPASTTDPLNKDSDEDGLWDSHEDKNKNGFKDDNEPDPNVKDTDDGGVADGTEVLVDYTDPLDPLDDNVADPDGDGLTNGEEKTIGTKQYDADSDGDTIPDNVEVGENHLDPTNFDGDEFIDALDEDSDDDGIPDSVEAGDDNPDTDPVNSDDDEIPDYHDDDSDNDGISDAEEWAVDADLDGSPDHDADGDGTPNYLDLDSDDVQESDQEEGTDDSDNDGIPDFVDPVDDNPDDLDYDGDGLKNGVEQEDGTDIYNADTDSDGLNDKAEKDALTDPLDADCDDDGLPDGPDGTADGDGDGLINARDPDSDDDGVFDGTERGIKVPTAAFTYDNAKGVSFDIAGTDESAGNFQADVNSDTLTDHTLYDTDGDGAGDGAEDPNHNGKADFGEMDPLDGDNTGLTDSEIATALEDDDGDGLTNRQEWGQGIVKVDGDLDDDGIADGAEHNWRCDTDRDGLPNLRDPDSDGDGLADGLEEGLEAPDLPSHTYQKVRSFVADTDPDSVTYSLIADSDADGVRDGLEDSNHNGKVDVDDGESDPADGTDTVETVDTDGDSLSDGEEQTLGLDPADGDTDDDGIPDGAEANAGFDLDGDGLICALDVDSDNDGLADGTEAGLTAPAMEEATATDQGRFIADEDPATTTWPSVWDSDRSGLSDGNEDTDKDGMVDTGESDPLDPLDDALICTDTDSDGLCNAEEEFAGTDPKDADSDDDGLMDGLEHNWNFDTDDDDVPNALDPDSDGDLLFDGTEMGIAGAVPGGAAQGTDVTAGFFVVDEDPESTTFMLVVDTDRGGFTDGAEDLNLNGRVDLDLHETDPNNPKDDKPLSADLDGDGIPNDVELKLGTDPYEPDSDFDTIPDNVEVGDDYDNPPDTDGDGAIDALDTDSDGDTLPDSVEAGDADVDTAPIDTDGDGLPDYRDTDSDDDQLSDDDEANFYHTDHLLADTDGGGAGDHLEVTVHMSDPNDPADDFKGWFEDGSSVQGGSCGASGNGDGLVGLLVMLLMLVLLRVAKPGTALVVALTVAGHMLLIPAKAQADYEPTWTYHPDATSTAIEGNYFRLAPDGDGVFMLQGDTVPLNLEFRGGLSLHYVHRPLTLVRDGEILRDLIGPRFESHINAAAGLFDIIEVGLQAPFVLYQDAQYPGQKLGAVDVAGIGSLALFAKVQALSEKNYPLGLAVFVPFYSPTGNREAYMGYDGWGIAPTVAITRRFAPVMLALNLSYRLQPQTTINNVTDDDKLMAGLGTTVQISEELEAGVELLTMTRALSPFADAQEFQSELDLGAKYRIGHFRIIAGGGKGLSAGHMTPSFRIFAGLEYAYKPDPDRDGDGIVNLIDDCPDSPEDYDRFEDDDGCPEDDNDGDRFPDIEDRCPNDPEDLDWYQDEDGCPELDNDGDGVPDLKDLCPLQPEDMDDFQDRDGCPEDDNDGDGIVDAEDKCPNETETFNDYKDEDGCPDKKLAEFQREARRIQILDKIHFKFMSDELNPKSYELLDQIVQIFKDNPQVLFVQVEGHTDHTGKHRFNMDLSLKRAQAVVNYLSEKGIDLKRLKAKGYGSTRRIDYRIGPEANFNNRRVEFNILKFDEPK